VGQSKVVRRQASQRSRCLAQQREVAARVGRNRCKELGHAFSNGPPFVFSVIFHFQQSPSQGIREIKHPLSWLRLCLEVNGDTRPLGSFFASIQLAALDHEFCFHRFLLCIPESYGKSLLIWNILDVILLSNDDFTKTRPFFSL